MTEIRAVVFDFGGVLVRTDDVSLHRQWEKRLGLQAEELSFAVFASEHAIQATLGQITVAEVWEEVGRRFELSVEECSALEQDFFRHDVLDEKLVLFLAGLRPQYRTAILSNAFPGAREAFSQRYGLDKVVDILIISAEEGLKKPDPRIYQLAAERLGVQPDEMIFVDDWLRSVEAAREVGMQAIHFQDREQAIAEVRGLLAGVDV